MVISFNFQWRTAAASVLWLLTSWCCISLNQADDQEYTYAVGIPTSATVCDGDTVTLVCDISESKGAYPVWIVFTTSDTSSSPVASIKIGENIPPYNYPTVQAGDTVARLEVNTSSSIDGYHFQCRINHIPPVHSPGTGSITVTGIPSCPTGVNLDSSTFGNNGCDVSLTWQQPPNTPPVTSTTVTYCPTSSPNCGNSMTCTSPCTISGLDPGTEYRFTVIPNNICGSPTGSTGNTVTHRHVSCQGTVEEFSMSATQTSTATAITPTSIPTGSSAGVIRRVELSIILILFCLVALFLRFW